MQLIQKMILTLLAIALLPVFAVSIIFYLNTSSSLRDRELGRLETIAAIQQTRVEHLIVQNRELLTAYTARTVLRANLDRYNLHRLPADQELVQQSVNTLQTGNKTFRGVSIFNARGEAVATTPAASSGSDNTVKETLARGRLGVDVTSMVARNNKGELSLYMTGPFMLSGQLIGVAVIESDMSDLLDLTTNYTGLGATGETLLVRHNGQAGDVYLLPLRFDKDAALRRGLGDTTAKNPAAQALAGQVGTSVGELDYRDKPVLAATRYIAPAGWGLVVKTDQAEAYQPLAELSNLLLVVMFILSVIIIFLAFYLARRMNEPILDLATVAEKIRGGDLKARANASTKDEIGQLADTFNAMADNVEKVDQMKSEFVLLTSHQLRTPATAVKGFMSMLLDNYAGRISTKQRELVTAAYDENERQISVINSILDVARMEAGEMVLVRAQHDLGQVIEASAEGQRPILQGHHQTLKLIKPEHPVIQWVDATKLQLVVDNFIHNAIKYSPPNTEITVELRHSSRQSIIEIRDQGFGIARSDLPLLFKRFSRIAAPHTANVQGAGLGLYLAEKLVGMHGGNIKVHSREGVGTRFVITIPNMKDPEA